MAYRGQVLRLPLNKTGFQYDRNTDEIVETAVIIPSYNINTHEGGIGKRGGTAKSGAAFAGSVSGRGLFQFRKQNGTRFAMIATSAGKVYYDAEANLLRTGLSTNNPFSFDVMDDKVFIAEGASTPHYWDGVAGATVAITPNLDWATYSDRPFQVITHSRNASHRMAYICKRGVYLSKLNDGTDASVAGGGLFIPIYSNGGLVAGFDFNGTLFACSKTKTYIINDTDADTANWGYHEAVWDGGVGHFNLIAKAANDVYLTTEEGDVYSVRAVQSSGSYEAVSVTRPAFMDRYIRENVTLANVAQFSARYDRRLRCIKFFMQVGGTGTNTAFCYFIDKPPERAWAIHNNANYASGYKASCAGEIQVSAGVWEIWTMDYVGQLWRLEQSTKSDNGNGYDAGPKWNAWFFGRPRCWKHFRSCRLRTYAIGNFALTVRVWIDGERMTDIPLSVSGSGAAFDSATFESSVFADSQIIPADFEIGQYGYSLQLEIVNSNAGEDFFHAELMFDIKFLGERVPIPS